MNLYDVFLQSTELKKLIVRRSFEYKIPLRILCRETGIKYLKFMRSYINSGRTEDRGVFTEKQFSELLGILGIEIRYQFVVDTSKDMKAVMRELELKYKHT